MTPQECFNTLIAQKTIEELRKRNIEGFFCRTQAEAVAKALELIPRDSTISCGGSATVRQIGVKEALKNRGNLFLDPDEAEGASAKDKVAHEALGVDYFLMGCNAIAATGELINMDGYGNRVASLIFGPKHVIIIAGINKVEPDLDAAVLRAKNHAAPLVVLLFNQGFNSFDDLAQAADTACSHLVITRRSTNPDRIKVILVGERLGY
jgi:L-lactate utilization protein LutB